MFRVRKQSTDKENISFIFPVKEQIDLDALNELSQGISAFLSCSYQSDETNHILTFNIKDTIMFPDAGAFLCENKNVFIAEVIDALKECKEKKLPSCNILLDLTSVFVIEGHLKFILLPIERKLAESKEKLFSKVFKLFDIPKEQRKTFMNIVKASPDDDFCLQQLKAQLETECTATATAENQTNLIGEGETTFLNSDNEGETILLSNQGENIETDDETTFLTEEPSEAFAGIGETAILSNDEKHMEMTAFLVRNRTGERISITQPIFVIGKSGGNADFEINDNPGISRQHASLILEGQECFIIDNNAKNKTYVEGTAICPFDRVELENGTIFSLANENFQVFMESKVN